MNYKVIPTPRFKKQAKKLLKKYRSLADELGKLEADLINQPTLGKSLGHNAYKYTTVHFRFVKTAATAAQTGA